MGLCLDRGAEMVTAMVGAWLAGAAYLPLDPAYPAARLAYMLAASRARLVVCRGGAAGRAAVGRVLLRSMTRRCGRRWPGCRCCRCRGLAAGRLAYVIFTSGSTGMPKGVAVPMPGWGTWRRRRAGLGGGAGGAGAAVRVVQF